MKIDWSLGGLAPPQETLKASLVNGKRVIILEGIIIIILTPITLLVKVSLDFYFIFILFTHDSY